MSQEIMLKALLDTYTLKDKLEADKLDAIRNLLPVEIREAIDQLELEYKVKSMEVDNTIKEMEDNIKVVVLSQQKSVGCDGLQVIYNKGRTSWNNQALEGYALDHPELLKLKKVGEPFVSFKFKKEGGKEDGESSS